ADGYLPLDQVASAAALPDALSVMPVWVSNTTDPGSVTNQAETSLKADLARTLGLTGAGVRVGVISDGASAGVVASSQASGDLPTGSQLQILNAGSGNEGAAMMELIYDIAPGVTLKFYGGGGTDASMATAINALVASGVDIIADDLNGLFAE